MANLFFGVKRAQQDARELHVLKVFRIRLTVYLRLHECEVIFELSIERRIFQLRLQLVAFRCDAQQRLKNDELFLDVGGVGENSVNGLSEVFRVEENNAD